HDGVLRASGFASFPILAPRWDVTGEDSYGTDCPGMTALGDVRQLQVMQRRKAQAIQKMIDPPLVGSSELRTQKTSLLPGDITYVRDPQYGLRSVHDVALNLEHLVRDMAETQYRIQRAFYEDLFLMLARSDEQLGADRPTAREIEERHEEKLLALGPVLERTNDELLDPLIDRTYLLMERAGLLPEPPEDLHGVSLKVEYISIMAQAQQLVGVVGQDRFLASVAPLVQVYPEVRHKVNVNRVVDRYAAMLGIDPQIVRSDEEAAALAEQDAAQQRAVAEAQQMQMMARAARDAGSTPVAPDSALDRVVGNVAPTLG
ncbi:MAG TPA: portal protein, partial [Xanthobacteraceae bacterium]|nr:portal protein [Xanthobacteraceae bacterium]